MSTITSQIESPQQRGLVFAHVVGLGVFALLKAVAALVPGLLTCCFSVPAARVTAFFLGTPLEVTPQDGITLYHRVIEISVTNGCSGFSFFSLGCALLTGFAAMRFSRRQWLLDMPVLLLATYAITILTNSFRMISAVQIRIYSSKWIPRIL